jgi:hypothetical protein
MDDSIRAELIDHPMSECGVGQITGEDLNGSSRQIVPDPDAVEEGLYWNKAADPHLEVVRSPYKVVSNADIMTTS